MTGRKPADFREDLIMSEKQPAQAPEQSPYEKFIYDRIVNTAKAAHGLDTSIFDGNGCAPSVSGILKASIGYEFANKQSVPEIYKNSIRGAMPEVGALNAEQLAAWRAHEADPKHHAQPNTPTPGAVPGCFAIYRDGGTQKDPRIEHHLGIVGKVERGVVTEVLSNSTKANAFVHNEVALPGKTDDRSLTFYKLPITPELVRHALDVPEPHFDKSSTLNAACVIENHHGHIKSPGLEPKTHVFAEQPFDRADETWRIAGSRTADGRPTRETEFKNLTVAEGIFEARHGKVFHYEFEPKPGEDPKVIALQNEILHRAILSNLPTPELQAHYAETVGLKVGPEDALTRAVLADKTGPLDEKLARDALNTINAAVVDAKKQRTDIADFVPGKGVPATPEQIEKINDVLHNAVLKQLSPEHQAIYQQKIGHDVDTKTSPTSPPPSPRPEPPSQAPDTPVPGTPGATVGVAAPPTQTARGTPIWQPTPNFQYRGMVAEVHEPSRTFVVTARNETQAFGISIDAVGGQSPQPGSTVDVALRNGVGTVTPVPERARENVLGR